VFISCSRKACRHVLFVAVAWSSWAYLSGIVDNLKLTHRGSSGLGAVSDIYDCLVIWVVYYAGRIYKYGKRKASVCGLSVRSVGSWARRWINHWSLWRMVSATPDLRLPSQPQDITAAWLVPDLLLGDRGTCVWTTCPRLLPESGTAGDGTRDLSADRNCHYTTRQHTLSVP